MTAHSPQAEKFLQLHRVGSPLVMPNPWDIGSARILESLGFKALATTSSGYATSLGRSDGSLTRSEALAHAVQIATNVKVPVSADLENGFDHEPAAVGETVKAAVKAGLVGCSIEDWSGDEIYHIDIAVARIAAAVEAANGQLILTARAENHLHACDNLADTIDRLQRFQDVGADVLYAPGLTQLHEIKSLLISVDRPVNVLLMPSGPTVGELAAIGARRISIGGTFAHAALGALVRAAREIQYCEPYTFWDLSNEGQEMTTWSELEAVQRNTRRKDHRVKQ